MEFKSLVNKTPFYKMAQHNHQNTNHSHVTRTDSDCHQVLAPSTQLQVQVWAPTWTLHANVAEELVSSPQRLSLGPAALLSLHVSL